MQTNLKYKKSKSIFRVTIFVFFFHEIKAEPIILKLFYALLLQICPVYVENVVQSEDIGSGSTNMMQLFAVPDLAPGPPRGSVGKK
jgi:hypothetical protein